MNNILTIEDAAKLIGLAPRTLKNKLWSDKRSDMPPAHKTGRNVYFFYDEVEKWMRSQPLINATKRRAGRPRKSQQGVA